jgi:LEA14-like dessication related protein
MFVLVPALIISIAACVSCTSFKPIELKKVESIKVLNSSLSGVDMEINMLISNPNFLTCTITDGDLNIVLNKVDMGKAELKNQVSLPAHAALSQKFIIHVGVSNALLGGLASLLSIFKSNQATITMKGTIQARALGISHTFPVDETTNIPFSY